MKFLLTATPRRLQMPTTALIEAARAWINARIEDGTFDVCYGFPAGGGFCIVNADSADRINQLLTEYPGYMASDWKIEPLCDINRALDNTVAMIKRAGG